MSAEPVAWKVYGHRGEFVTLRREEAYGYTELMGRARKDGYETVTPLYAESPHIARAMAIAECASMVERWEATYDGADSDLSLLADDMRSLSPAPSVTEEWVAEIINSIPGGVNSEDCYSAVRATLAALGVEVKS